MAIEATNPALQAASQILQQRQQARLESGVGAGQDTTRTTAVEARGQQGAAVDRGTDGVRFRVTGEDSATTAAGNRRDPGQPQRGSIVNILV